MTARVPSPGREVATFTARGPEGALKLPQRVQAEPSRQTYFSAFGAKNQVHRNDDF